MYTLSKNIHLLSGRNSFINSFSLKKDKLIPTKINSTDINNVPDFLKQNGFSDSYINSIISRYPRLISTKVKTLQPKFTLLQELGLSSSDITDLIHKNPSILAYSIDTTLLPNINFLQSYFHSNSNIVKALKKSNWLLTMDLPKIIGANVEILSECGVRDERISSFMLQYPRFFTLKADQMKNNVSRAEKFGFKKGSGMFIHALFVLSCMNEATVKAKFEMFERYGWSESDIVSAFKKSPYCLGVSEQKVKAVADFFIEELGYSHTDISSKPTLFSYSLEKRVKPRYEVLKILKSKGLVKSTLSLLSVMDMPEKKFLEKFVLVHIEEVPDRILQTLNYSILS